MLEGDDAMVRSGSAHRLKSGFSFAGNAQYGTPSVCQGGD